MKFLVVGNAARSLILFSSVFLQASASYEFRALQEDLDLSFELILPSQKEVNVTLPESESPSRSQYPSSTPSAEPSGAIDTILDPSTNSTNIPSAEPSGTIDTILDSSTNSTNHTSRAPSPSPSVPPLTIHPSLVHNSTSPSAEPSHGQTSYPSNAPSDLPSQVPTNHPSQVPTNYPSQVPTEYPSQVPTAQPTQGPTDQPTQGPTDQPTQMPSFFPSSSPTLECHDRDDYQSPINGLSCLDHQGTDCKDWLYVLGRNITALEELINSCPVSCKIPCGAFLQQRIDLSFIISGVPGLLDVVTQTPLEEVALDYLLNYVRANKVDEFSFHLKTVLLKSQQPLFRRQLRSSRQVQASADSTAQLRVVLSLIGFSISIDTDRLTRLLIAGVDSNGFTDALQASGQFYATAQASSAVREFPKSIEVAPMEDIKDPGVSGTTIGVAVVVGLCLAVAAAFFSFRYYQRYQYNREESVGSRSFREEISPSSSSSTDSGALFARSRGDSSSPRGTRYYPEGNLLGSLSRSRDSDEDEDSIWTGTHRSALAKDKKRTVDDNRKHPLTGKVPIMVVIDNIDDDTPEKPNETGEPVVVPTKRVSATASFTQALHRNSIKPLEILCAFSSPKSSETKTCTTPCSVSSGASTEGTRFIAPSVDGSSPISLDGENSSVSSTPAKATEMDLGDTPKLRRSASGGDVDCVQNVASWGDLIRSSLASPASKRFSRHHKQKAAASPPRTKRKATRAPLSSLVGRTMRTQKSFKEAETARIRSQSTSPGRNSEVKFPSLSRTRSGPEVDKSSKPSHVRARSHGRGSSDSSLDQHAIKYKHSKSGSAIDSAKYSTEELRYAIDAPTEVKLGLTIASGQKGGGSNIHFVKEYSPLYGLVYSGDKILSIDSVNTMKMDAPAIHRLLSNKRGNKGVIRLIVARAPDKTSIPTLPPLEGNESPRLGSVAWEGTTVLPPSFAIPAPPTPKIEEDEILPVFLNHIGDDEGTGADSYFE